MFAELLMKKIYLKTVLSIRTETESIVKIIN